MSFLDERRVALNGDRAKDSSLFLKLRAAAAVSCLLAGTMPGYAQQAPQTAQPAPQTQGATQGLPQEPAPNFTQPLFMRPSPRDFSKPRNYWPNPIAPYIGDGSARRRIF